MTIDDQFAVDDFAGAGEPEPGAIPREQRWGKPKLPHPVTGKVQTWRRPSSITRPLEDRYLLEQWEKRAVAKGMAHREHLRALAYASPDLDQPESRQILNDVAREAMGWTGTHARAARGTAQHMLFDAYNRTGAIPGDDQPAMRDDVLAYAAALTAYGLTIDVDKIERMGICPDVDAAGSWDGIGYRSGAGDGMHWRLPRILDAKTGTDPAQYHTMAYAAQQAIYARCTVMVPRWWDAERGADQYEPMPLVDQERATLIWVELGKAEVDFIDVDLVAGWELAQLAVDIMRWRKRKDLLMTAFSWRRDVPTVDPDADDAGDVAATVAGGQVPLPPPEPMKPRTPEQQAEREREVDALLAETAAGKVPPRKRAAKRAPVSREQMEATRKVVMAERAAATAARAGAVAVPFVDTIHEALTAAIIAPLPDELPAPDALAVAAAEIRAWLPADGSAPVDPHPMTVQAPGRSVCLHGEPACGPCRGLPITEWTLREKVANAATREVLSALWAGNVAVWSDELTALGKARLAELGG